MNAQDGSISQRTASRPVRWSAERRFHVGFTLAIMTAVLLGFSRTFFLRPWFSEWADAHGSPEPFFYFHGIVFFAWFVLLLAQPSLVAAGRVDLHRRLGQFGAGLAVVMVVLGTVGALIAARRPTGFMDVSLPPLQFIVVPLADIALFGVFVALALVRRHSVQSHKRYMLLASIALLNAAVGRWPLAVMTAGLPVPRFSVTDVFVDLFLVPMVVWDFASRGRVHPVTLSGGLTLIVFQPVRLMVSETDAWLSLAGWAVSLLGR
jgi:hypothetical protein